MTIAPHEDAYGADWVSLLLLERGREVVIVDDGSPRYGEVLSKRRE